MSSPRTQRRHDQRGRSTGSPARPTVGAPQVVQPGTTNCSAGSRARTALPPSRAPRRPPRPREHPALPGARHRAERDRDLRRGPNGHGALAGLGFRTNAPRSPTPAPTAPPRSGTPRVRGSAETVSAAVPGSVLAVDPAVTSGIVLVVGTSYTGTRPVTGIGTKPSTRASASAPPPAAGPGPGDRGGRGQPVHLLIAASAAGSPRVSTGCSPPRSATTRPGRSSPSTTTPPGNGSSCR